jgi:hypothetical protein
VCYNSKDIFDGLNKKCPRCSWQISTSVRIYGDADFDDPVPAMPAAPKLPPLSALAAASVSDEKDAAAAKAVAVIKNTEAE